MIKRVRSDNTAEFVGMETDLKVKGIVLIASAPYSRNSSGLVELMTYASMYVIGALLKNADSFRRYCREAHNHAASLHGCLIFSAIENIKAH